MDIEPSRPRYARHVKSPSGEAQEAVGATGHCHRHRSRSLLESFGTGGVSRLQRRLGPCGSAIGAPGVERPPASAAAPNLQPFLAVEPVLLLVILLTRWHCHERSLQIGFAQSHADECNDLTPTMRRSLNEFFVDLMRLEKRMVTREIEALEASDEKACSDDDCQE